MTATIIIGRKGSAKSGNYGHAGRPGKLGGSAPKAAAITAKFAAIPDTFKNPELRAKFDQYVHSHDIVSEDLMIDGQPITLSNKRPPGWGTKYGAGQDWNTAVNAAISSGKNGVTLHISPAMLNEHPEFLLHEIGHVRWAERMAPSARQPFKQAQNWWDPSQEISSMARDLKHEDMAKIGTRVYQVVPEVKKLDKFMGGKTAPTGRNIGITDWNEAYADLFSSWRLGGPEVRSNITAFLAKHKMDADVLFGDKRHDPQYLKASRW